jgi:hypothetical protein
LLFVAIILNKHLNWLARVGHSPSLKFHANTFAVLDLVYKDRRTNLRLSEINGCILEIFFRQKDENGQLKKE